MEDQQGRHSAHAQRGPEEGWRQDSFTIQEPRASVRGRLAFPWQGPRPSLVSLHATQLMPQVGLPLCFCL